ncbi:hypothetical protein DVH24_000829 [Malus domestica]|uniref:Uncharacterized protein n=1 Tax=Malus domestica TaxID=3750 RepID=A0A498K3S4_MALDO|nr:hypothetical protein DVH24_000829 [Malus domestica]
MARERGFEVGGVMKSNLDIVAGGGTPSYEPRSTLLLADAWATENFSSVAKCSFGQIIGQEVLNGPLELSFESLRDIMRWVIDERVWRRRDGFKSRGRARAFLLVNTVLLKTRFSAAASQVLLGEREGRGIELRLKTRFSAAASQVWLWREERRRTEGLEWGQRDYDPRLSSQLFDSFVDSKSLKDSAANSPIFHGSTVDDAFATQPASEAFSPPSIYSESNGQGFDGGFGGSDDPILPAPSKMLPEEGFAIRE